METVGLDTQPTATTYDLEDIVGHAWHGRVRVPHFQRDFRWATSDVLRLFDSIVKGYPIGSLLLWVRKSPADSLVLGRLSIEAPAFDDTLWVVDGQQRITSLANALHPEGHQHPPFTVYYDLAERQFVSAPKMRLPQHLPLPVLFDLQKLIEWFAREGQPAAEYFPEAQRVAKVLRQFRVPAYLVRQEDEKVLTDIFDRMNNFGKRLSRAEVFSALFAGPEEGASDRMSLSLIADRVAARTGFGTIDSDTILSAILARRAPDPYRDIRNEFDPAARRTAPEFPDEDRDAAYSHGEEALVRAVEFLQSEAGVPHLALLAYQAPLVVLTRFFAHFPSPTANTMRLLRRLYWRLAVSGPAVFKGSFTTIGRVLSVRIRQGDELGSIMALMDAVAGALPSLPSAGRFKTNEAATKIMLCAWWSLGPRSLVTGERLDEENLATLLADQATAATVAYRIFTRGLPAQQRNRAANRLLLPSETDPVSEIPQLLSRQLVDLGTETWDTVLASHCLDRDMVRVLVDNPEYFLHLRQAAIERQLRGFLGRMAEWDYEDTPELDLLDLDDLDESGDEPG